MIDTSLTVRTGVVIKEGRMFVLLTNIQVKFLFAEKIMCTTLITFERWGDAVR